jgi:thioredoxin-like negative regulator of GroEL
MAGETPRDQFTRLTSRIEASMDRPGERMNLADCFFSFADDADVRALPQLRLKALTQAARLHPFRRAFRLTLARELRTAGLANDAAAELRSAERSGFELDDEERLELGRALLEIGKVEEARGCFNAVTLADLRLQAHFDLVECDLRSADSAEEWKRVFDTLKALELPDNGTRRERALQLYSERCLKFAIECGDRELVANLANHVAEKWAASLGNSRHPAYDLFLDVTSAPNGHSPSGKLEGLLLAHRATKQYPITGNDNERIEALKVWRGLVAGEENDWFGLREAYLHALDSWAMEAYRRKEFEVARSLWSEAERIAPMSSRVVKNLAIVSTRANDDSGSAWYWDRLGRVWNFHAELAPEADGYTEALLQKSQAFAEGAEKKLPAAKTPEERLEIAEILAKEALSYLVLRQIRFRNPLLRCGVLAEDYSDKAERKERLAEGHKSASRGLQLIAEWQHLGADSELVRYRKARLDEALRSARLKGSGKFVSYQQEEEAFLALRKQASRHFLNLVGLLREFAEVEFTVPLFPPFIARRRTCLTPSEDAAKDSEQVSRNKALASRQFFESLPDSESRRKMAIIASAAASFPYRLLKPEVLRAVKGLSEETDFQQLTEGSALGPWLTHARQRMQSKDYFEAGSVLEEALTVVPDSALARFFLAQCHAIEERFVRAYSILLEARQFCGTGELRTEIDKFADQMDFKRVDQALAAATTCLRGGDAEGAILECFALQDRFENHPYLLFVLGQAYAANLDIADAKATLEKARDAHPVEEDDQLSQAIGGLLVQLENSGYAMVLSKAVPLMQEERWTDAAKVLAKGIALEPPHPRVTFYEAVCLAHSGQVQQAERKAREAIAQCNAAAVPKPRRNTGKQSAQQIQIAEIYVPPDTSEERKLREEIEAFVPQIPLLIISSEMNKAQQAMARERWRDALRELDAALVKRPNAVAVLFLKAVCYFRMEQWDQAETIARTTAPLCGPYDAERRKQLDLLLEQVPLARIQKDMEFINQSIQAQRWREALRRIDSVLLVVPSQQVCLFYRALCHFKLDEWDQAERATETALESVTQREIRDQLETLRNAIPPARRAAETSQIVTAINNGNYDRALNLIEQKRTRVAHDCSPSESFPTILRHIEQKTTSSLLEPGLAYLKAVCQFRQVMDKLNSHKVSPGQSLFFPVYETLAEVRGKVKDRELKAQVDALLENVNRVCKQLRDSGYN